MNPVLPFQGQLVAGRRKMMVWTVSRRVVELHRIHSVGRSGAPRLAETVVQPKGGLQRRSRDRRDPAAALLQHGHVWTLSHQRHISSISTCDGMVGQYSRRDGRLTTREVETVLEARVRPCVSTLLHRLLLCGIVARYKCCQKLQRGVSASVTLGERGSAKSAFLSPTYPSSKSEQSSTQLL